MTSSEDFWGKLSLVIICSGGQKLITRGVNVRALSWIFFGPFMLVIDITQVYPVHSMDYGKRFIVRNINQDTHVAALQ